MCTLNMWSAVYVHSRVYIYIVCVCVYTQRWVPCKLFWAEPRVIYMYVYINMGVCFQYSM